MSRLRYPCLINLFCVASLNTAYVLKRYKGIFLEDIAYGGGEDAAGVVLHKFAFGFDGQTHVGRYEPFHASASIQAQAVCAT